VGEPPRLLHPDPAHGAEVDRRLEARERADHRLVRNVGATQEKAEQVADVFGGLGPREGRIGELGV
jgi:hypothetical protein